MELSIFKFRVMLALTITAIVGFLTDCTHSGPLITESAYPVAVDAKRVGSYPAWTKSGAGYFYDDVLEYRVWINPPEGGDDYYKAFAKYEDAAAFSRETSGAEDPLVLILQKEWIDEPEPGVFVPQREERITEWRVEWLANSKRSPGAIERFLEEHKRKETGDKIPSTPSP